MQIPLNIRLVLTVTTFILLYSCKTKTKEPSATNSGIPAVHISQPEGFVTDDEQLLTKEQAAVLNGMLWVHEQETGNEIVVVTQSLDTVFATRPGAFEQYARELFNKWGVGKKDRNNGVGLLIAANLRKVRIETGKGLTTKLTDREAKAIIDEIVIPNFKKQAYYDGIRYAVEALIAQLK